MSTQEQETPLQPSGGKAHAPIQMIRDLESTSGYWAAVWTICCMQDAHVICDAPIGCFNLVGTAVPDYTDAIPHIENLTPSTMREQEVTMTGTAPAVRKAVDAVRRLHPDREVIVVSTAESEMISSDHGDWLSKLEPACPFYWSRSLEEEEWTGRDRVLVWLWDQFGKRNAKPEATAERLVNIIGPTYGCFNSPADLHELKRLIQGAGGTVNLVYPMEAKLADTPRLSESAVNVVMYREFGESLAAALGKPHVFAPFGVNETTEFIRELGQLLGTSEQAEAFIANEKKTTLAPLWDLWRGPQGDWFATTEVAIVAGKSYTRGLTRLLEQELGMKVQFAVSRPYEHGGMDNLSIRTSLHKKQPGFVFGSINEKIYLTEAGARATFYIPASFPGAIVRRALGTPFMGYSGVIYIVQEMANRYYEVVFNFLPFDNVAAANAAGKAPQVPDNLSQARGLVWSEAAREQMESSLEGIPWLSRISATRELRATVERYAIRKSITEVTVEVVQQALAAA